MKIAISASSFASSVDQAPLVFLLSKGCEIVKNQCGRKLSIDETISLLQGADGLLAGLETLNRQVLTSCRNQLKAIARIGAEINNVDMAAATEFGIKVSSTPDAIASSVAEMTIAALLAICHRLIPANKNMHSQIWKKELRRSLSGLSVLIIGHGSVGRAVAESLKIFGSKILIFDPMDALALSSASLAELLPQADVISLHTVGDGLILGPSEFKLMRPGTILLNSARADLVDEMSLLTALHSGSLAGCWLDVFSQEPYDGPLCDFENVLLTPRLATHTEQCRIQVELQAAKNLLRDLNVM